MSNRIKTLRDYSNDYHYSVSNPEKFWSEGIILTGEENGSVLNWI